MGQQAFQKGDLEQAQEAFSAAVAECEKSQLGGSNLALSLNNLAAVLSRLGFLDPAISCAERALQAYGQPLSGLDGELGVGLLNLAELYLRRGRLTDAEAALLSAEEKLSRGGDEEARRTQKDRLGQLYLQQEKLPQAIEVYRRSIEEMRGLEPEPTEEVARTYHMLSNLHEAVGNIQEGQECRRQCLERLRSVWVDFPQSLGEVMVNMAESLAAAGRVPEALPLLEESIGYFGSSDFETGAQVHLLYLAALRDSGKAAQAVELGAELSALWESSAFLGRLHSEIGLSHFLLEDFSSAAGLFSRALEGPLAADDISFRISNLYNLAAAQQGGGSQEESLATYSRALSLGQEHLPPGHSLTARIVWNYSGLLEQLGHNDEAQELRDRFGAAL